MQGCTAGRAQQVCVGAQWCEFSFAAAECNSGCSLLLGRSASTLTRHPYDYLSCCSNGAPQQRRSSTAAATALRMPVLYDADQHAVTAHSLRCGAVAARSLSKQCKRFRGRVTTFFLFPRSRLPAAEWPAAGQQVTAAPRARDTCHASEEQQQSSCNRTFTARKGVQACAAEP